jgi:hypothetical protein
MDLFKLPLMALTVFMLGWDCYVTRIFLQNSSSWVKINLFTEFQPPRLPRSCKFMVGDKSKKKRQQAEAELCQAQVKLGKPASSLSQQFKIFLLLNIGTQYFGKL